MDDNYFDKTIKARLEEHSAEFKPEAWNAMQRRLDATAVPTKSRPWKLYVAAATIGGLLTLGSLCVFDLYRENQLLQEQVSELKQAYGSDTQGINKSGVLNSQKSAEPQRDQYNQPGSDKINEPDSQKNDARGNQLTQRQVQPSRSQSLQVAPRTPNSHIRSSADPQSTYAAKSTRQSHSVAQSTHMPPENSSAEQALGEHSQTEHSQTEHSPQRQAQQKTIRRDLERQIEGSEQIQLSGLMFDINSPKPAGMPDLLLNESRLTYLDFDMPAERRNSSPWQLSLSNSFLTLAPEAGENDVSYALGLSTTYQLSSAVKLSANATLLLVQYDVDATDLARLVPGAISGFPGVDLSQGEFKSLHAETTQIDLALGAQYFVPLGNKLSAFFGADYSLTFGLRQEYQSLFGVDANTEIALESEFADANASLGSLQLSAGMDFRLAERLSYQVSIFYQNGHFPVGDESIGFQSAGIRNALALRL